MGSLEVLRFKTASVRQLSITPLMGAEYNVLQVELGDVYQAAVIGQIGKLKTK